MVSVIIPSRSAAATLAETIKSLHVQTVGDWEAIVVENGSTDGTAAAAEALASKDPRIRVLRSRAEGPGAARNEGLRAARGEWVLFLDADDWVVPAFLEKMTGPLRGDPNLDGTYCGFDRVTTDGRSGGSDLYAGNEDLFALFARRCAWSIHCAIVRRSLVEEVGGFPEELATCEDWLLWQRLFRAGARFARVPEILALYRVRPASASMDGLRMARDTIRVVGIGHGPDPAVRNPRPEYANGLPAADAPAARLSALVWSAALLVGHGEEGRQVLELVPEDRDPDFPAEILAYAIHEGARLPRSLPESDWIGLWPALEGRIRDLLDAYERRTGAPYLARRALRIFEKLVLSNTNEPGSLLFGSIRKVRIELTEEIRDLETDPAAERIECALDYGGRPFGSVGLPVCDGLVPAPVLADAIADEHAFSLLDLYWEDAARRAPRGGVLFLASLGRRCARAAAACLGKRRKDFERWALATIGWATLLHELFPREPAEGPVRAGPGVSPRVELCDPIPDLAIEGERTDIILEFAGLPIGTVRLASPGGTVRAGAVRRAAIDSCCLELSRLTVREAVLGRSPLGAATLRERLRERLERRRAERREGGPAGKSGDPAARIYGTDGESALLLARRTPGEIGTSASRRAALPASAAEDLLETAETLGEGVLAPSSGRERTPRVLYAPEVFAPGTGETADGLGRPVDTRTVRGAHTAVRFVQRVFPSTRRTLGRLAVADRLPILLYHRVADDGPAELVKYRVPPGAFEEQVRFLRERGFYTIDLETWLEARSRRRQLRGRPILITFDDGYEDFAASAWPILRKAGFTATVFLVVNRVGRTASWDAPNGGKGAPLLTAEAIRPLQEEGVSFGSHAMNHVPLTALSTEELVREGTRSRRALAGMLGKPVRAFAYPYGDHDAVVRHLIGACGYVYGLTCDRDFCRYSHPLLALPRIEVEGGLTIDEFAPLVEPWRREGPR
ncbi:MAG: glycosyltransferase [Candidatus Eisenbacteria bacterium]